MPCAGDPVSSCPGAHEHNTTRKEKARERAGEARAALRSSDLSFVAVKGAQWHRKLASCMSGLPPRPNRAPRSAGPPRLWAGAQSLGPKETHRLRVVASVALVIVTLFWAWSHSGTVVYPTKISDVVEEDSTAPSVSSEKNVEIVIARYNDNLEWLPPIAKMLDARVTVYCKNREAKEPVYPCHEYLENVGNEGHTYLLHITRHYHTGLKRLMVFLPDTAEYGDKLKTWRRFKRNLENIGGDIYYADDWTPITAFRYTLNFLNMVFYGPNFPCKDTRQGGTQCQYFGHTGGANEGGHLTTASPPNFRDWLRVHMRTSQFQIARCGWGNRGMFAASRAAIQKHPRELYVNLLNELSRDAFPMAGMFMERLWRRVFLCSAGGDLYPVLPGATGELAIRAAGGGWGPEGNGTAAGTGGGAGAAGASVRRSGSRQLRGLERDGGRWPGGESFLLQEAAEGGSAGAAAEGGAVGRSGARSSSGGGGSSRRAGRRKADE